MFRARLEEAATLVAARITATLQEMEPLPVVEAMAHATVGGKALRGFLVLETARLHDVTPDAAIWPATAIEALHAYSLVHDDLPAMDDDDLRRGQPTVHRKWDEATAILAGDALHSLAFEMVTRQEVGTGETRALLAQTLAVAAGAQGMVYGQALDIAAETVPEPLTLDQIVTLQQGKTGALIQWASLAGARMAGADTAPLEVYSGALGLAFQIADDILDVEGDAETVGKATGKDADAGKATFVSLLGLEAAKARATALVDEACDALSLYGTKAETLKEAARFVISRSS